jgi:carbamoyl-phosphate synthase small subunit
VVAYDFGIKSNILRGLLHCGGRVTVVPSKTSAAEVLRLKPDGVFLSNGPGDPEAVGYAVENVRALLGKTPIFGICLGHQIMGLAFGGRTFKLKFGHHGGNQPVLDIERNQVEITAQNHGFAVDPESLNLNEVRVTHINLNDKTVEGMAHAKYPAFSVQYHPEASPGPHDSFYLFEKFFKMMKDHA